MKNKKGFTLIELLAVIVILGLLMAIAIPSVTKYIQQSRKKTLLDTMQSYTTAVVNGVNDMEYGTLSNGDNLYYIPIECVSLEKGGSDPFGDWEEAYVVVHYNADEYTYDYYFTYYDSAGYGMELTPIDEMSQSDITNPTTMNKDTITEQKLDDEDIIVMDESSCSSSDAVAKGMNLTDSNGNNKADVGEKVCIGTECFYVISNDGSNVKALAEYNLESQYEHIPGNDDRFNKLSSYSGMQKKWVYSGMGNMYGNYAEFFSNSIYWKKTAGTKIDISNSSNIIYPYLTVYKQKLNSLGGKVSDIGLIDIDTLKTVFGCNTSSFECSKAPSWLFNNLSYWTCSSAGGDYLYSVYSNFSGTGVLGKTLYNNYCGNGIRPVITVNASDLKIK